MASPPSGCSFGRTPRRILALQLIIYLVMGWVAVLEFDAILAALPSAGTAWLFIGGIAYTVGVVFYVLDKAGKMKHAHGIWHAFVLAGSISHFIAVIGFVR